MGRLTRLDVEGDNRLGNGSRLVGGGLLGTVLSNTLSLNTLVLSSGLLVLIVGSEEI